MAFYQSSVDRWQHRVTPLSSQWHWAAYLRHNHQGSREPSCSVMLAMRGHVDPVLIQLTFAHVYEWLFFVNSEKLYCLESKHRFQ